MEKKLIDAPFDEKNLSADCLRDDIFCDNFMAMRDNGKRGKSHFIGKCMVYDERIKNCLNYWGYVEVTWYNTNNVIEIKVIGVEATEDWEETRDAIFEHYKKIFSSWMNEDNDDLVVKFDSDDDELFVQFYWSAD